MTETLDLLAPLELDRCGRDHKHALDAVLLLEQPGGGNAHGGLAEPEIVRQ